MKKIPQRTCLGCGEAKPKKELIRIVKQNDGNIFIDKTGKANGRGAYLKPIGSRCTGKAHACGSIPPTAANLMK